MNIFLIILLNIFVRTIIFLGMSFGIYQQPINNPGWVGEKGITQFSQSKNIGLLAHNYRDGKYFGSLKIGDIIQVVTTENRIIKYEITGIYKYERPSGNLFIDPATRIKYSDRMIWNKFYNRDGITLQTCIKKDDNYTWGILFVIGKLIDEKKEEFD